MERFKAVVLANAPVSYGQPSFARQDATELVPVANKPILFHALEALSDADVRDVALIVDPQTGEEIREVVRDGSEWRLRVSYVPRRDLGLIDAVQAAKHVLSDSPFVVYPGNGVLLSSLDPLLRRFRRERLQALLPLGPGEPLGAGAQPTLSNVDGPPLTGDGIAPTQDGVCVFGSLVHAAANAVVPSWRGQLELEDVLRSMVESGQRVEARRLEGWSSYQGDAHGLLELNRLLLDRLVDHREDAYVSDSTIEGRVAISGSARVESSTIRGPVIIGPGAQVADAFIGPYTSVGRSAIVRGAEVENSIIMTGAQVKDLGARIAGSVIGEEVTVNRDFSLPRVLELAVAHGSTATLG